MIKITSILLTAFWLALGSVPTYFITTEYVELKTAAKTNEDKKVLASLGFIDDANEIAFVGQ